MPISIEKFEQLEPVDDHPDAETVYAYLAEYSERGFTATEIADQTELDWEKVIEALIYLHDDGQVRMKGVYWAVA